MRGLDSRSGTRHVLARIANIGIEIEHGEKKREESKAPEAAQIQPVDAHEAGRQPKQICDEEGDSFGRATFALARYHVDRDDRQDDQRAPIEPMGQHEIKARHRPLNPAGQTAIEKIPKTAPSPSASSASASSASEVELLALVHVGRDVTATRAFHDLELGL